MSVAALGWWVEGLLVEHLGCTRADAERIGGSLAKKGVRDPVMTAATVAALAEATPNLPGGREWWSAEGSAARTLVLDGRADQAERLVAKALGASLDPAWDGAHRTAEMLFAASNDPEA